MTLLLDTQVFLRWRLNSRRLTRVVREHIATAEIVWISAASAWEVAIKRQLGRLALDQSFASNVEDSDFSALPITFEHAERAGLLRRTMRIRSTVCSWPSLSSRGPHWSRTTASSSPTARTFSRPERGRRAYRSRNSTTRN